MNKNALLFSICFDISVLSVLSQEAWFINQQIITPIKGAKNYPHYIRNDLVKLQEEDHELILNRKIPDMFFILPAHKVFYHGTTKEIPTGFSFLWTFKIEQAIRMLTKTEQERYKGFIFRPGKQDSEEPILPLRNIEIHITVINPHTKLRPGKILNCRNSIEMPDIFNGYSDIKEYSSLLNTGYSLRSVNYFDFFTEINEVTEFKCLSLAEAAFLPPIDFQSISLPDLPLLQITTS